MTACCGALGCYCSQRDVQGSAGQQSEVSINSLCIICMVLAKAAVSSICIELGRGKAKLA